MNKKYKWLIFDADDTLFTFDSFKGLKLMFSELGFEFTPDDFEIYNKTNRNLWDQFQNNEVSIDELKISRFEHWSKKINLPADKLNILFLDAMAKISEPLPHAIDTIIELSQLYKLVLITNGFKHIQEIRLKKHGLNNCFKHIVTSEEVGFAKPQKQIFDHAHKLMELPDRNKVLMIGDSIESDMIGANAAGFDTCWLNHQNKKSEANIELTYQIKSINELRFLLI